jgi:hypothetical protein
VTLTVNAVTQDEPVNGLGDGDTAPDARLVAGHSEQVDVRSERAGNGDGRFYRITFGGDDGRGGTCTATKNVTVRHKPGQGTHRLRRGVQLVLIRRSRAALRPIAAAASGRGAAASREPSGEGAPGSM